MNEPSQELRYKVLLKEADKLISSIEIRLQSVLTTNSLSAEKSLEGSGVQLLEEIGVVVSRLADLNKRIIL